MVATSGDYLRLWRVGGENGARIEILLNNVCSFCGFCLKIVVISEVFCMQKLCSFSQVNQLFFNSVGHGIHNGFLR